MNKLVVLLLAVTACGKGGDKAATSGSGSGGSATAVVNVGSGSGSGTGTGSAVAVTKPVVNPGSGSGSGSSAKKPPPTKAAKADYSKHMRAGYAAQKSQTWAAAVPEFEAAVKAIPGDQRALTELGWSAMNAGDYAKAKKIDAEAIAVTGDKKVKAMGLYNLGLVQEKLGDKEGALRSFVASLQLRPNATVESEVGKLGNKPAADAPFCAAGSSACDCITTYEFGETGSDDDKPTCDDDATDVPATLAGLGFHAYQVKQQWKEWTVLVDEHNQLVAQIGGEGDHGHFYEDLGVEKAEVKTIGTHKVLRLETHDQVSTTRPEQIDDTHDGEVDTQDLTYADTICVLADAKAKTATKCVLRDVPRAHTNDALHIVDDGGSGAPIEKPGEHVETDLDIAIGDDGTVTVKLLKGSLDPAQQPNLGPHKLW